MLFSSQTKAYFYSVIAILMLGSEKKLVMSNAFRETPFTRDQEGSVPCYDHYKQMFNISDIFNKGLYANSVPNKVGGHGTPGEEGHFHKFIMSCLLKNIDHLFKNVPSCNYSTLTFENFCSLLV